MKDNSDRSQVEDLLAICNDLNLDFESISLHKKRINDFLLKKDLKNILKVVDTCRKDNHLIHNLNDLDKKLDSCELLDLEFTGFIPAAGAGSRYFEPLHKKFQKLLDPDESIRKQSANELLDFSNLIPSPVVTVLKKIIKSDTDPDTLERATILQSALNQPKALQKTSSNATFLTLKNKEHTILDGINSQIFVCPPSYQKIFEKESKKWAAQIPTYFITQNLSMSTLRFGADGNPIRDELGQPSIVAAGHGTLVKAFPEIYAIEPKIKAIFIRNIDNVLENKKESREEVNQILQIFKKLLWLLTNIRTLIENKNWVGAEAFAKSLDSRGSWGIDNPNLHYKNLWSILAEFFYGGFNLKKHTQMNQFQEEQLLKQLFSRPLNILGQVKNSVQDKGGGPVVVKNKDGHEFVMSLESSHASEEDRKIYLDDLNKAMYFNSAVVVSELPKDPNYFLTTEEFWLISKKQWNGQEVYYHESLLYEILGNSLLNNLVFVEISRNLFRPHKTILDNKFAQD